MIRVLLADDHALFRAALNSLLDTFDDIRVVGTAQNGRDALAMIKDHEPNIVLMDIRMPELNGLEATSNIVRDFPDVRVIALSGDANETSVIEVMRRGAAGYLVKDIDPVELHRALRAVARGEKYLATAIAAGVVKNLLQRDPGEPTSDDGLTQRQREVLQLIAEGNSTKEIARKLGISDKTVETHRTNLMAVLDIHDVAGLTRYAMRSGIAGRDR